MLKIIETLSTPTCLVAECGGAVTKDDYAVWDEAADAAIAAAGAGKASAVFIMTSSPCDADWDAMKADFELGAHEYQEFARVAYVGDVKWVDFVVKAFGWMTKAEEKTYSANETDAAVAWARAR